MRYLAIILIICITSCVKIEQRSFTVAGRQAGDIVNEGMAQKDKGVVLQDFNTNTKGWYGCNDLELEVENSSLKLELQDARFQCIGSYLEVNDLSDLGVVHFRIRVYTEQKEDLTMKIRFEDINGVETNYDEENVFVKVNQDYKDYYIDFRERLVSVNGSFNKESVSKMKVFFNTKGSQLFTGSIWVDEIGLAPQIPENL